jgi:hypothetical protein
MLKPGTIGRRSKIRSGSRRRTIKNQKRAEDEEETKTER